MDFITFDLERIPYAVLALLLSLALGMVFGPRGGNAAPAYWLLASNLWAPVGARLDRPHRGKADLTFRAFLLLSFALLIAGLIGAGAGYLVQFYPFHGATEMLLLLLIITTGPVFYIILKLFFALSGDKVSENSFYALARTTRIDLNSTDNFGLVRIALGTLARLFDKGLVAPLFWYFLFGFTGGFVYLTLAALAWRFDRYGSGSAFGHMMGAMEKLLGFIPNWVSAVYIALAALIVPTANPVRAFDGIITSKARYPQGGRTLASMAYALNVSLGGPVKDLDGHSMPLSWVGPKKATAKIDYQHLKRGLYLYFIAQLLFVASLLSMYVLFS